ncbi:MAG: transcriptional regulator, NifA subfamily, Fis family, partial [Acidobacteria bacterium]|nr:transcriptional regulator, NifA subfamily, Fis family [Acidobacteriota bacterium]
GRIREAVDAAESAIKCVSETNNPAINYAFMTILAEVRLESGDYGEALALIHQFEKDEVHKSTPYVSGHAHYVAASAYFQCGRFDAALRHIDDLCSAQSREAPFYERELAEALKARICFERGFYRKALTKLYSLEKEVTQKHWPYHMCIVKLHLAEILIRRKMLPVAERIAKNSIRLSKGMRAVSFTAHGHLLLGLIYSSTGKVDNAISEFQSADSAIDTSLPNEIAWRAQAELCFLYQKLSKTELSLEYAEKAYACLCSLESHVPKEMLSLYRNSFDRDRIKSELVRLIEAGRQQMQESGAAAGIQEDDKSGILLRASAAVNSILDLNKLMEEILDQLIRAVGVERAFVFLKDESTEKLQFACGRDYRRQSIPGCEAALRTIADQVCDQGRPIVSVNARNDFRISGERRPAEAGKLLCAPLRSAGRVMGVLYADHSSPAESLSESLINLFAAFCNLSAIAIDNALAHEQLVQEKSELEQYLHHARDPYIEIVGKGMAIETLRDRIGLAAASPLDILITGESGTGKELVASAIHRTGRRKEGKFVPVDCGALSDSLAEAELFGYRKGAFTGAVESRIGLLESANGGVLFLDEISNLPSRLQPKLLRVLQEREVRRIGETTSRGIDIQVIAATNKDLLEEIRKGEFRRDLYYRLRGMEIRVPPLRGRSEDIPLLLEWFLNETIQLEGGRLKTFSPKAKDILKAYHYPGNVRELKNIVLEAYYSAKTSVIDADELPPEVYRGNAEESLPPPVDAARIYSEILEGIGDFEHLVRTPFLQHQFGTPVVKGIIERALRDSGGRYREAFAKLRIPDRQYSVVMRFLKRNQCYLDFRPFRRIQTRLSI